MKTRKKSKLKTASYIFAALTAALVLFVLLLLYKPAAFTTPDTIDDGRLSRYLTHELAPQFYNSAQRQQPFDMVISEAGANDIICRSNWPKQLDSFTFAAPQVFFVPDNIVLMTKASFGKFKFVVTVVITPAYDEDGLLHLSAVKVKVGAVSMTFIAKTVAKRMYFEHLASSNIDAQDLWSQLTASLPADKPFTPVFKAEDKKAQLKNITITQGKLTVHFTPTQSKSLN